MASSISEIMTPDLRRKKALLREYDKIMSNDEQPLHQDLVNPPPNRLKSRHPPLLLASELKQSVFNPEIAWKTRWLQQGLTSPIFDFQSNRKGAFQLQRNLCCNLNRLRMGHGR